MKAVVFERYGSPDYLTLKEVEKPVPGDNQVLVKVHAASINEWDWGIIHGTPFINRLSTGILNPKKQKLGADMAGVVETVGKNISRFQPGDEVFGDICVSASGNIPEYRGGTFAEYVCTHEKALLRKPASLTFEQAASLPQAGALAIQGLLKGGIHQAKKALINGAGGGAGTLAIQIAKSFGAEVTAVDNESKLDSMRSLGADHVIDYRKENFTKNGLCYDLILDVMGFHSIFNIQRTLCPNGKYVMLGGGSGYSSQVMFLGPLFSIITKKKMGVLLLKPDKDLDVLVKLIEADKVAPVIDRTFLLSETANAFRYYKEGNFCGKIIISLS